MYKELKIIEKIDFQGIWDSKIPVFWFDYKKYDESKMRKFIENVLDKYWYHMLWINYNLDYRWFEKFFNGKNLDTFTGLERDNKYVQLGYCVSNIWEDLNIYKTSTPYNYLHIINQQLNIQEISDICIDTINVESGFDIFFIFITETLIIYPHIDRWFSFIDIDSSNSKIIKEIVDLLRVEEYVIYEGNEYAEKYISRHKINIKFEK